MNFGCSAVSDIENFFANESELRFGLTDNRNFW